MQSPSRSLSRSRPHLSTYDPMLRTGQTYFATLPKELRMEAYKYTRKLCKYQIDFDILNPFVIKLQISGLHVYPFDIYFEEMYIKRSKITLWEFIRYLESNTTTNAKTKEKNRIQITEQRYMDKQGNYLRIFYPSIFYGWIQDEVTLHELPICDELLDALQEMYVRFYQS